jgi:hypothetical protein
MAAAPFRPPRPWPSFLIVFVAVLWHGTALCQPNPLWLHSAIQDPVRQRMIVFAGNDGVQMTNDVWQLALAGAPRWDSLAPLGDLPSKRLGQSAIYDPVRDRLLAFGGVDSAGNVLADVWALSLSDPPTWSSLEPSGTGPSARYYHTAIYDPVRDRMLVFGGSPQSGFPFNDVWSLWLSPTPRWEQLLPAGTKPAVRYGHSAIYDPVRDRMLVFSGGGFATNDVWALSLGGTPSWTLLGPSGTLPLQRQGHTALYDPVADRMIVFGGDALSQPLDDVWQLSLAGTPAWTLVSFTGNSPSPRAYHSAVYDSAYRRMVVFGGYPNVSDPTWVLSLADPMRWSPSRPVIEVTPAELQLQTVLIGDTISVPFLVSDDGLEPLRVTAIDLPIPGMGLNPPAPFELGWSEAAAETLTLVASTPGSIRDSVVIESNDPITPRRQMLLSVDVLGLEFQTRVLGTPAQVPLGESFIVVVTPRPGVRIDRGTLYYRVAGATAFDSLSLTPLATDFIAVVPASAVTERGVEYYVRVEHNHYLATQPAGAPAEVDTQEVAPPTSITAVPRPTSGSDFLVGRGIEVDVQLPEGAAFLSGTIHYRQGGETGYATDSLALGGVLGEPVATIPDSVIGPRGVEYWVEARTLDASLRFPAADPENAIIRTKVPDLTEPSYHPGARYRLLTVPLDFGPDFSGSLEALLADQLGTYDPSHWRAYAYDPTLPGNIELSSDPAAVFRPQPGRAFWLISRSAHRVSTAPIAGFSTPTGQDYAIPLAQGWNLFGNPFDFPVTWSEVRRDPTVTGDPVAFDPSLGTIGDYAEQAPSVLEPFEGYFIHADQATTLWMPPHAASSGVTLTPATAPGGRAAREDPGDVWRFGLRAWTERAADGSNSFGVHSAAQPGYDALDWPKPPPSPGPGVQVCFVHPEWGDRAGSYRRDLRGPGSEGETWQIEVRSDAPGEPVTLELTEQVAAPPGLALRLIDLEQGSSLDWQRQQETPSDSTGAGLEGDRSVLRYGITSYGGRPYRLSIVAGTEDYVTRSSQQWLVIPARLMLDPIAPNPFRLSARIRFGLPRAEPATLEIYNVLGGRVAVPLDRARLAPGWHTVVWDGKTSGGEPAPSGVYFVRLSSEGASGMRRLVLVR